MAFSCKWTSPHASAMQKKAHLKSLKRQPTVTVSMVGSPDAGKGSLLNAYTNGQYPDTERPDHKRTVSIMSHDATIIKVCDTPGDIQLNTSDRRKGKRRASSGPVGLVAVYDVADRKSLEEAVRVLERHRQDEPLLHGMVLVGTWVGVRSTGRAVTYKEGKDAASQLGASFLEVGCNNESRGLIQNMVKKLAVECSNCWLQRHQVEEWTRKRQSPYILIGPVLRLLRRGN